MRLSRLPVGRLLTGGALALALVAFALWRFPSSDFLFLPNRAQPLAGKVKVASGQIPTFG